MATTIDLASLGKDPRRALARALQSGHLNFLFGSGASAPGIPIAGPAEATIEALLAAGKQEEATRRAYDFARSFQTPTNKLIKGDPDAGNAQSVSNYQAFLRAIEQILTERKTTLLPRQATVFTTNYDLFFEKAALSSSSLRVNDGFTRVPSLDTRMTYSSRAFFTSTYNTGNLYSYKVEIPTINLVKLHGSLSWKKDAGEILFQVSARDLLAAGAGAKDMQTYLEAYAIVLPRSDKFRETVLDRTYYELLRIYANQLDQENALLIVYGFSFRDEHIVEITKHALRNPTLRVVIFAFDDAAVKAYSQLFAAHHNVEIVCPAASGTIDFPAFTAALIRVLPEGTKA